MAKRQGKTLHTLKSAKTDNVAAFAEHVGRMAGSLHAKADRLFDAGVDGHGALKQAKRIRDAAARLLVQLARTKKRAEKKRPADPKGRSGGAVDAPGKKHRKAPARAKGPSRSEKRPKRNVAREMAKGRRS